jgi:hypothetical protein
MLSLFLIFNNFVGEKVSLPHQFVFNNGKMLCKLSHPFRNYRVICIPCTNWKRGAFEIGFYVKRVNLHF